MYSPSADMPSLPPEYARKKAHKLKCSEGAFRALYHAWLAYASAPTVGDHYNLLNCLNQCGIRVNANDVKAIERAAEKAVA